MNIHKLMVGDWLQHANGKYFQVTRIDMWGDGSVHFACGHPHLWEYNNEFSPIPLTPEILEKNGFHKVWNGSWKLNNTNLLIDEDNGFYVGISMLSLRLDYVHELQHILRLCGIDKKIPISEWN